jgi:general secretion pathway protein M
MTQPSQQLRALRDAWRAKWSALAPRERRMATIAGWLLLLAVVVLVGIRPAWRTLAATPAQLKEVDAQLDQMRRLADEVQLLRQRPPVPPAQAEAALRSASDRLGQAAKLAVQGDRATLTVRDVPGESLASWLDEVRTAARARPLEANLQQAQAGHYSGSIVLSLSTAQAPR